MRFIRLIHAKNGKKGPQKFDKKRAAVTAQRPNGRTADEKKSRKIDDL